MAWVWTTLKSLLSRTPYIKIILVPLGKGHKSKQQDTSLLYNEYIVYDISQVKMKYLIDLKFVFDGQLPW